jgi:hypothetical protein
MASKIEKVEEKRKTKNTSLKDEEKGELEVLSGMSTIGHPSAF